MRTIGLICEGVSEINVMTRIVSKYLGDDVFVTNNCIYALNQALGKKNIGGIPEKDKNGASARMVYGKVLKGFKNRKTIQDCAQYHYGFQELVKQLDAIQDR